MNKVTHPSGHFVGRPTHLTKLIYEEYCLVEHRDSSDQVLHFLHDSCMIGLQRLRI